MAYVYNLDTQLPLKFNKNGKPVSLGCINVAESSSDAARFSKLGQRYIRFSGDALLLTKHIMLPILIKRFPGLKWNEILDIDRPRPIKITDFHEEVLQGEDVDNAEEDEGISDRNIDNSRSFTGCHKKLTKSQSDIGMFYADLENIVDFEMLMTLNMMPRFMSVILEATLLQADDLYWEEGYNKKLGLYTGKYNDQTQGRNLLIIDCSASIPRPISAALLSMAESLREKLVADVIFTAGRSFYYEYGKELPTPQELRDMLPLGNESSMFKAIIRTQILGKEWDNIVCFGDGDNPGDFGKLTVEKIGAGTKVGHVYNMWVPWSPHDAKDGQQFVPGYARWAYEFCDPEQSTYLQTWVKSFKR